MNTTARKYNIGELETLTLQKLGDKNLPKWERDVFEFVREWRGDSDTLEVRTSGTTGEPRVYQVTKEAMRISARKTLDFFNLKPGDSALLCLSSKYIAGKLMIVRSFVGELDLIIQEPSATPLDDAVGNIDFAAMVPMQVQKQLDTNPDAFDRLKTLIIGGGEVSPLLKERLQKISTEVWETYGMTETLTHIALKKLNGNDNSDWFKPLPGVTVSNNSDSCLVVEVEGITEEPLVTHDLVEFDYQNGFRIEGRVDDVINTGGIKVIPTEIEKRIEKYISRPYVISSINDKMLGDKVVLAIEGDAFNVEELLEDINNLEFYEIPKDIIFVPQLPRTETGKIKRSVVREMIS